MAGKVRLTTDDVPVIWLVTPAGKPFKHPVGLCFNSKVIRYDGGTPQLRPGAVARGYRYLRDVLAPDEVALWQEYAAAEKAAKGKLRLPPELRPRALRVAQPGTRQKARIFVPAALMAATTKRVSVEVPNTPDAPEAEGPDPRDGQIAELVEASKAMAAELALLREEKQLLEQLAAEQSASAEIESATAEAKDKTKAAKKTAAEDRI
ncbi:MAG: hypothetical protein IPH07_24370 [Deltaproteobacteria bacterium]|nr:hypothetical protein [Deltaproteobacteria bacterium]